MEKYYYTGNTETDAGMVPQVSTRLNSRDLLGTIMVRWSINRDNYKVAPGLYSVGSPDSTSDVFVTANYKLSFDHLRKNLDGINGWILVLDTKGINVWCAAGKGTFGTKELIKQITETQLQKVVHHKRIIVPQLGATGVAAHEIKEATGFHVFYGPVKASDIKEFVLARYKKTKEMRTVTFNTYDRAKLIPVDIMYGGYYLLAAIVIFFILGMLLKSDLSSKESVVYGLHAVFNLLSGYFSGIILTPLLLPILPSRSFAVKGLITGIITYITLFLLQLAGENIFENIAWLLIISGISSFMAMNFTGSTTFTSLSGVQKEMKIALPIQITISTIGIILFVVGLMV